MQPVAWVSRHSANPAIDGRRLRGGLARCQNAAKYKSTDSKVGGSSGGFHRTSRGVRSGRQFRPMEILAGHQQRAQPSEPVACEAATPFH